LGRVVLERNTNSGVDAMDAFTRADVSIQDRVAELTGVDRSVGRGRRARLPDLLQLVRHRDRLAYSWLPAA